MQNGTISVVQKFPNGTVRNHQGELQMDEFKSLLGVENGEFTVGHTFSDKVYGNGVETFVSLTLKCSQDAKKFYEGITKAHNFILQYLAPLHSEGLATWKRDEEINRDIIGAQ